MGYLLYSAAAGSITGVIFFGGLWLTISRMRKSKRPHLLLFASFILRTAIMLGIGYAVCADDFFLIIFYLLGFIAARTVIMHKANRSSNYSGQKGAETCDT